MESNYDIFKELRGMNLILSWIQIYEYQRNESMMNILLSLFTRKISKKMWYIYIMLHELVFGVFPGCYSMKEIRFLKCMDIDDKFLSLIKHSKIKEELRNINHLFLSERRQVLPENIVNIQHSDIKKILSFHIYLKIHHHYGILLQKHFLSMKAIPQKL